MRTRSSPFVLVPVAAFIGAVALTGACKSSSSTNTSAGGPTARFVMPSGGAMPSYMDVPFPSDIYLVNGKYVDPIPAMDQIVRQNAAFLTHELAKLSGFSRAALANFYVDDPSQPLDDDGNVAYSKIDPKTLPIDEAACAADTSSVFLLDLAASDPSKARVACRAAFHDDEAKGTSHTRPTIAIGPARGVVLQEGHKYVAVLTNRVKDANGVAIAASDDFKSATTDASTPMGTLYSDAMTKAKAILGGVLGADAIVSLAPYTTQTITHELYDLRDALETAAAPTLAWDATSCAPMTPAKFAAVASGGTLPTGFTASLDGWLGVASQKLPDGTDDPDDNLTVRAHDQIGAIGTAVFQGASYLQDKGGYSNQDDATFAYDASGHVIPSPQHPTVPIWITISIPKSAMPATGYPVVIVQHGLSGSRDYLLDLANTFAAKGWASVAIDSVTFGARAPEAMYQVDSTTDYVSAPGATYKGPDGISDTVNGSRNGSFDLFGGLQNLGALRDQMRQAELDTSQVVKLLRSTPDLSPLNTGAGVPTFDATRIAYIGDSLGGIQGGVAAAIEPHLRAWTLNVAGGGIFQEIASHGPGINVQLASAGGLLFGFTGDLFNESHLLVSIGATIAEAGDPLVYAGNLVTTPQPLTGAATTPRNIFQTEVVYDELVANEGGEALARAAGYGLATPNVGSNAGVYDVKNPSDSHGLVPLANVQGDTTGIHDTPIPGYTAVVVQTSPGAHGSDLVSSKGTRSYTIPFNRDDSSDPFNRVDDSQDWHPRCAYLGLQATMTRFFSDAFAGNVPVITGFPTPIRDADDDGVTDDQDADPNNPAVH